MQVSDGVSSNERARRESSLSKKTGERPLKIAYIVGSFPALSETFVVNQVAGMAARGHVVDIYTTHEEDTGDHFSDATRRYGLKDRTQCIRGFESRWATMMYIAGYGLLNLFRRPLQMARLARIVARDPKAGTLRLCFAALSLMRGGPRSYDIIHAQFAPFGILAVNLVEAGALRGAVVTSFRGYDAGRPLAQGAYRELFQRGTMFLPVSRSIAARLVAAGCRPERVRIHHSGVNTRLLRYHEGRPIGDHVRVITVARLVEKKGLRDAIEAVARVIGSGKRLSYTIVGEGPQRAELERLVGELGMQAHIRLAGAKSHDAVLDMINAAHVLIAPSITAADGDEEGIPNAMKEAMAMGVPVIGTRHGGIPELVDDGISGYLVPERDAAALAERITHLIENPATWSTLGEAGRAKIEREYDIDKLNDELVSLYRETARIAESGESVSAVPRGVIRSFNRIRRV